MAGVMDNTGDPAEIGSPDPFEKMNGMLGEIRDALTTHGVDTVFDLVPNAAAPQSTHIRIRVSKFVFSVSAAAAVTLTIGTFARVFNLAVADVRTIHLPIVIDRGVDISLTYSGGATGVAYLIYVPE